MQYGGAAKVDVLAWIVGAVRALRAAEHPVVARRYLVRPEHATSREIERDDGVAGWNADAGVGIAGADVDELALGVDGGRRPDARARWAIKLGAGCVGLIHFRRIGNRVGLPNDAARFGVERSQAAAKRAALILRR